VPQTRRSARHGEGGGVKKKKKKAVQPKGEKNVLGVFSAEKSLKKGAVYRWVV